MFSVDFSILDQNDFKKLSVNNKTFICAQLILNSFIKIPDMLYHVSNKWSYDQFIKDKNLSMVFSQGGLNDKNELNAFPSYSFTDTLSHEVIQIYTENNIGYAIPFDLKEIEQICLKNNVLFGKILYSDDIEKIKSLTIFKSLDIDTDLFNQLINSFIKTGDWNYENEYRMISLEKINRIRLNWKKELWLINFSKNEARNQDTIHETEILPRLNV